ncbi:MAG TPA: hypothetical protein DD414_01335 [Lachnospiraceae bacterium]|nr:hypothetical protein [Lachnospiraceae bacterium]
MSLYLLTFLMLAAGTFFTWFKPLQENRVYYPCWAVMTLCLCFRFGQGTDYVTYHALYETIPLAVDLSKGYIFGFHPEIGWRIVSAAFKVFGAPFWVFTMALGFGEMLLLHRYLSKYCKKKTMGLFMLYPVLFVTYMVSGLRQGLAICVFLGVALPFYMERKWVRYVLAALVAASFHKVGYVWLILPVVSYIPARAMAGLAGLSVAGGAVLQVKAVKYLIVNLMGTYHMWELLFHGDRSFFAIGERMVSFLVLCFLYFYSEKKHGRTEKSTELLFNAYTCGFCFYMLLCVSSYYASRYCVVFKVLEGALVLALLKEEEWVSKLAAVFFVCLTLLMGYKNLNAMIQEAVWYDASTVNLWNFPYISVFHQEKIFDYMSYDKRLKEMYDYHIEDQKLWMIEK